MSTPVESRSVVGLENSLILLYHGPLSKTSLSLPFPNLHAKASPARFLSDIRRTDAFVGKVFIDPANDGYRFE